MPEIGEVVVANGQVMAVSGAESRILSAGSPVYEGDEITTGPGANVEIRFSDDSILAQGPSGSMSLDNYVFDPDEPSTSEMVYKAATGTFRVVTGKIADMNPDGVQVSTPLAVIGIRGTGLDVESGDQGLKIGIFYYHRFDLVVTSPAGTRFLTDGNMLIEVFPDGTLGQPRPYTDQEKASFETLAPITSMDEVSGAEDDEDAGDDDDEANEQDSAGDEDGPDDSTGDVAEDEDIPEEFFDTIPGLLGMDSMVLVSPGDMLEYDELGLGEEVQEFLGLDEADDDDDDELIAEGEDTVSGIVIVGGEGNDVLLGSESAETLMGLGGDDYLYGACGNDCLVGGPGVDSLYGGDGNDTIAYRSGDAVNGEIVDGGTGDNTLVVLSNEADFSGCSFYGDTFSVVYLESGQTAIFAGSQISGN